MYKPFIVGNYVDMLLSLRKMLPTTLNNVLYTDGELMD